MIIFITFLSNVQYIAMWQEYDESMLLQSLCVYVCKYPCKQLTYDNVPISILKKKTKQT